MQTHRKRQEAIEARRRVDLRERLLQGATVLANSIGRLVKRSSKLRSEQRRRRERMRAAAPAPGKKRFVLMALKHAADAESLPSAPHLSL